MKRIIIVSILVLLFAFPAMAEQEEPKERNYEVVITIKYNSMPVSEMQRLITELTARHDSACKLEIKTKKLSHVRGGGYWLNITDTGNIVFDGVVE